MKKIVLFAAAAVFTGFVNAQDCTSLINYSAMEPGLNPNPPAGSVEGVAYNEVNTLLIPRQVDNTQTGPVGDSIPLCAIEILNVVGMPAGYTYEVWGINPANSLPYDVLAQTVDTISLYRNFPATRACIRLLNATPPASSDLGDGLPDRDTVEIEIQVGAYGNIGLPDPCTDLSGFGGLDTFVIKLPIKNAIYAGINDTEYNGFSVFYNSPNPANALTYLNFTTPNAANVNITLFDAVGKNVKTINMHSNVGMNNFPLSTIDLKSGIYIYNITYNGKTISKKLIVNK